MNFQEALNTGKVVVRSIFANKNNPEQISVQLFQKVEKPAEFKGAASEGFNPLVAMAQGLEAFDDKTTISAIMSFKKDIALKFFKTIEANYSESNKGILAENIYGCPVEISVIENTTKNPKSDTQTPVTTPKGEVKKLNGLPVYRHTELVPADKVVRTWVKYDKIAETSKEEPKQEAKASNAVFEAADTF